MISRIFTLAKQSVILVLSMFLCFINFLIYQCKPVAFSEEKIVIKLMAEDKMEKLNKSYRWVWRVEKIIFLQLVAFLFCVVNKITLELKVLYTNVIIIQFLAVFDTFYELLAGGVNYLLYARTQFFFSVSYLYYFLGF